MVALVQEFADGGSLDVALQANFNSGWTWNDPMLRIATDISHGLQYLHTTQYYDDAKNAFTSTILHRDMKPANVLLTMSLAAKVGDFGSSKALERNVEQTIIGTPIFMAPEVHTGDYYDEAADVFSFGMTIWAMSVGHKNLFKRVAKRVKASRHGQEGDLLSNNVSRVMNAMANQGVRPSLHEPEQADMPESLRALVTSCWQTAASHRPAMSEVCELLKSDVALEIEEKFTHQNNLFNAGLALQTKTVDLNFVAVRRASAARRSSCVGLLEAEIAARARSAAGPQLPSPAASPPGDRGRNQGQATPGHDDGTGGGKD